MSLPDTTGQAPPPRLPLPVSLLLLLLLVLVLLPVSTRVLVGAVRQSVVAVLLAVVGSLAALVLLPFRLPLSLPLPPLLLLVWALPPVSVRVSVGAVRQSSLQCCRRWWGHLLHWDCCRGRCCSLHRYCCSCGSPVAAWLMSRAAVPVLGLVSLGLAGLRAVKCLPCGIPAGSWRWAATRHRFRATAEVSRHGAASGPSHGESCADAETRHARDRNSAPSSDPAKPQFPPG
ncbi:hypothetical protein [Actinoplanes utahensis]|uniref:hypothetical protein n=1 Tax=Actinoplanes utahensis TaxID=1869 RepID=UPI00126A59C4|nr:hypothetical protein [Actinoplanes utahensis]